jgi:hypothetical protein
MSIESQGEPASRRNAVWKRGLIMLLLAIAFSAGHVVLNALAVVQFLWLLATGAPNRFLLGFGTSLSLWFGEVGRFMSCASDDKPFPWRAWP